MKRILPILFIIIANICYSQVDLNAGLVAYYPFTGNANDASGNNNNPVFNNATLTSDRNGNPNSAYHFNGTNNYMRIPNSPSLNMANQMSIALWVKATGYYTGPCYNNMLVMKGDADYLTGNYFLRFSDAYTGCTNPTTTQERFYGPGVISQLPLVQLNQWYSVVWTYDGTEAKMYVNCVLRDSALVSITTFTNSYDLFLGRLNNGQYPYWLNGDMDEIRIYNRAINQDEVKVFGFCTAVDPCSNWLKTQNVGSSVKIGDLDVPGNQVTVEATINRIEPYFGTYIYAGDIVSKHTDPNDANYLLRPNNAEITTTDGFFTTPSICDIELNKTYHIAMVYNGSSLNFFRNGFLMSQVAASGNLIQNNLITSIGDWANYTSPVGTQFLGYINEVRIWNVARTKAQIQSNMNSSLPNPASQTGLLAYYTFDNLLNKQGNATWNAALGGAASIGATNSNCNFIIDSCGIAAGPVPVTITDFNANVINNRIIKLTWNTEEEIGIKYYNVERAVSGRQDFVAIGSVDSKKSSLRNAYFLADNTAKPNILYQYRLAIYDADGSKKYSAIRTAKIINKEFYTVLYPNPTEGIIKLDMNNLTGSATIAVLNNMGQVVLNKQINAVGTQSVILDITKFPSGTYWISIQHDTVKTIEKIVKQ